MTPKLLSGSVAGKPIQITATTSGTANTIHTAVAGAVNFDEVTLYAANNDTSPRKLYLLIGGTTAAETVTVTLQAADGAYLVLDRHLINNALVIKAYAEAANVVVVTGRCALHEV